MKMQQTQLFYHFTISCAFVYIRFHEYSVAWDNETLPILIGFGQKPWPVVFGGVEGVSMVNEEDFEVDGIIFEDMVCD